MNLFNFVKSNLQIADVINEYVTLKNAGSYLKGSCPFHSEKTGSFTVSPHREIFYCFGCHESGDVIGFIAKLENCSQIEAAKLLTERYNLQPPEDLMKEVLSPEAIDRKKRYFHMCALLAEWCHKALLNCKEAQEYLTQRGFTKETIKTYQVGYFPGGLKSIKSLLAHIKKEGFLATDLIQAHLMQESKSILYSPFEERIIFPILDNIGQECGFGGRIFKKHDERAKYYNSRENQFFTKGSLLFGLNLAKRSIQKQNSIILVEGYTDCIALHQFGYKNTVATLGTACTSEHLAILSRYADTLYVLYDGDTAGQKAILRLTESCWNVNIELKVIGLASTDDPASFLFQGGSLKKLIEQSSNIVDFFIQHTSQEFAQKTLKQKLETIHKIIEIIWRIPDGLKRDMVLQQTAYALNVPFDTLTKELRSYSQKSRGPAKKVDVTPVAIYSGTLEDKLFSALLLLAETIDIQKYVYVIELLNEPLKEILFKLIEKKKTVKKITFTEFISTLSPENQQEVARRTIRFNQDELQEDFEFIINKFSKKHWKHIVKNTKIHIKEAQERNDAQEIKKLLLNMQSLKEKLLNINDN